MPSRANTTMKRKRRKSKLTMDFIEFSKDTTRFLRGAQYLRNTDDPGLRHLMVWFTPCWKAIESNVIEGQRGGGRGTERGR